MNKELKKGICRVCGRKTKQIFNVDFMRVYICKSCEYRIVKQSIMDIYKSTLNQPTKQNYEQRTIKTI